MVLKRFYLAFIFLNLLTFKALSQIKTSWVLPQHQLTAQFGVGTTFNVPDNNVDALSTVVGGLNYTYNFSRRWYAQASWHVMRGNYEMGERFYTGSRTEFRPVLVSAEAPLLLPMVRLSENQPTALSDIANAPIVKLTSSDALYERTQFSVIFGYMKVLPRNVLRVGVGIHERGTRSRTIATQIYNFNVPISHLLITKGRDWGYVGTISYDFFLTQKWSLGLNLGVAIRRDIEPNCFQSGLTVGYAPFKNHYKKSKSKPQA